MTYFFYNKHSKHNDNVDYSYTSGIYVVEDREIKIQVWADKNFPTHLKKTKGYFCHFDGILFVYDYTRKESFETVEKILRIAENDLKVGATLSLISLRMNASRDRIIDVRKASQLLYIHSLSFMKEFLQMDVKAAKEVLKRMIEETLKEKRKVNSQESSIFNKIYCFFSNNDKNGGDNEVVLKKLENHGIKLSMMRERERERKKRKEEQEWKERVQRGPLRNEMRGEDYEKKRHRGNDDDQSNNDDDQSNNDDDEKSLNMDDNNDMNSQKSTNFVDDSVKASFDCLDHVKGEDTSFMNNHVDGLMNSQIRNVDGSNSIQDNVHDSSHDALCKGIKNTHTLASHIINDKMHQNDKNKRDVHHLEIKTS